MEEYWIYIDFESDVPVEKIPVMVSRTYQGERIGSFRCTGAFLHRPDKDELKTHIRSYAAKYIRKQLDL